MRYWTMALALTASAACAPLINHVPPETLATGIDLRPFAAQGFLFSPNAYAGSFDAVGLVTVTVYAEATRAAVDNKLGSWSYSKVGAAEALEAARKQAIDLGADAIVNLAVRQVKKTVPSRAEVIEVPGVEVTGFAIKRK